MHSSHGSSLPGRTGLCSGGTPNTHLVGGCSSSLQHRCLCVNLLLLVRFQHTLNQLSHEVLELGACPPSLASLADTLPWQSASTCLQPLTGGVLVLPGTPCNQSKQGHDCGPLHPASWEVKLLGSVPLSAP